MLPFKGSIAYYIALHDQLEREMSFLPATAAELQEANRKMEDHLRNCPRGEEGVRLAKEASKTKHCRILAESLASQGKLEQIK